MSADSHFGGARGAEVWPSRPYRIRHATAAELERPLADNVLCAVVYGGASRFADPDIRRIYVPLKPLTPGVQGEIWESALPVRTGRYGAAEYIENGEVMLTRMSMPESDLVNTADATERIYQALTGFVERSQFPHLLRVWNYVPQINLGSGDGERYRAFTEGRFRVLSQRPGFERRLPAATAIGPAAGRFIVFAMSARIPGQAIENPQQISAYRYPRTYGMRSPSFARAMLVPWADGAELLVSGTASIVGHATAHPGDARAQLDQTMANLNALVRQPGLARRPFLPERYTLYLRDAEDYTSLYPPIQKYFGDRPFLILVGDICRRELMLEIEVTYRLPQFLNK